jgi:thiol:disulfide interchange protein DsbG
MQMSRLIALAVLMVSLAPVAVSAADDKKLPPLPAPLKNLVAEGAQIRYLGRENGMDGWVTMKQGQPQYFYVTPDQQAILMGIMFNNKGDVITLRQVNELRGKEGPALDALAGFPAPVKPDAETSTPALTTENLIESASPSSKSEQLYEAVSTANWIEIGKKEAPVLYSFIDPECPHCHDLLKDIRKSGFVEQGLLRLRVIPVGLISETSLQEAAFLLASSDPQTLLYKHLDGTPNVLLADPNVNTQGVQRNMSLMQDWKFDVTPFSVYKDANGKVKILRGRPNDLKEVVMQLR